MASILKERPEELKKYSKRTSTALNINWHLDRAKCLPEYLMVNERRGSKDLGILVDHKLSMSQ